MKEINSLLRKHDLKPVRYCKKGKATVIDTRKGKFVIKEKVKNNEIYKYLESRSFNYYPKFISNEAENYEITEYIDEIDMPSEQKIMDLIDLVILLHNKTTYYEEITEDDYKKIFEDISNNIEYLESYYTDLITVIESKVYMSPSEYLLARNISKIFASLNFCKYELKKWYELVKSKKKQRYVVLHNNLSIDHFLKNKGSYLISWDKAKIDNPIFDLYKLYKRHGLDYDFDPILKRYERGYPLLEEERKLLFILISLPDLIEFEQNEYNMCKKISRTIDFLYKTDNLISPYYSENRK